MSKYDIKKTPQLPSDEEINKHKNFDKVLKNAAMYDYKKATKPIYKNTKVLSIVAVIVAVGLIILFETTEEDAFLENTVEKVDSTQTEKSIPIVDSIKPTSTISSPSIPETSTHVNNITVPTQQAISNTVTSNTGVTTTNTSVNTGADFPGGDEALKSFLLANIKYPYNAIETPYTGKIEVDLKVEKTGEVSNFTIYHSPNAAISNEIQRVIKNMPKWQAALKDNQAVISTVTVYFPFTYIEH